VDFPDHVSVEQWRKKTGTGKIYMTLEQRDVIDFMNFFKQSVERRPVIPSVEIRRLRAKLIVEEAIETLLALGFKIQTKTDGYGASMLQNILKSKSILCQK
jgi:predicted HAD superfamily Cof-like phosphohydrolase